MNLALEIPKAHLSELSALTDVDFALAHLVLEDPEYADFYASQAKRKRRVILDNGMHEMGKPLTVPEILEAASRINPTTVIPPDRLQDAAFTYEGFHQMRKHPKNKWDTALVIQGETFDERCKLFMDGRMYTYTICLPYREPRTTWLQELVTAVPRHTPWPPHLHLFGMSTFDDIKFFVNMGHILAWNPRNITIDTAKPIKWAMAGKRIDSLDTLRGGGLLKHGEALTPQQLSDTLYNIAYMRRFMA